MHRGHRSTRSGRRSDRRRGHGRDVDRMSRRVSRGVARGDGATSIRETTRGVLDSNASTGAAVWYNADRAVGDFECDRSMDARPCTRCLNTRCARIVIVRRWASERCWRRPRRRCARRARGGQGETREYRWMSFREASDRASAIASGLVDLAGLKPRDKVIIYADTKRDWQLVATGVSCR